MQDDLALKAYHYDLPEENIAHYPAKRRDTSRLLVTNKDSGATRHLMFHDIVSLFKPGDLLVVNDTKVFPARLLGRKESGGKTEVFLLGYPVAITSLHRGERSLFECEALLKSSRPPHPGAVITIGASCRCTLLEPRSRGKWRIRLELFPGTTLEQLLAENGTIPLPPYIKRPDGPNETDHTRYQTIYAGQPGAVAAPTAGLHFTDELLNQLKGRGVQIAPLTLHVGYGTFAPVQTTDITRHRIHQEHVEISETTAALVNRTKRDGNHVWAVGTTTARALEFGMQAGGPLQPRSDWCDLYIVPGFTFRAIDNLITNFHLPCSSLMFLVAALCGREQLLACYREAIACGYRFYSYGDAMAIIRKNR